MGSMTADIPATSKRACSICGATDHDRRRCPQRNGTVKCGRCGGVNGHSSGCPTLGDPNARDLGQLSMDELVAAASKPGGRATVDRWVEQAKAELERTREEIRTLQADEQAQRSRLQMLEIVRGGARP